MQQSHLSSTLLAHNIWELYHVQVEEEGMERMGRIDRQAVLNRSVSPPPTVILSLR